MLNFMESSRPITNVAVFVSVKALVVVERTPNYAFVS